jgi:hypothetical protein
MASAFPQMIPSARSMTMGDLPSKTYRAMSGATVRRAFGNKKTQYVLKLQFQNIGDDTAVRAGAGTVNQILSHFDSANGTFDRFGLPGQLFKGMGGTSSSYFTQADVSWRYAKPPEIKNVKSGLSNVSVELIGEIDA